MTMLTEVQMMTLAEPSIVNGRMISGKGNPWTKNMVELGLFWAVCLRFKAFLRFLGGRNITNHTHLVRRNGAIVDIMRHGCLVGVCFVIGIQSLYKP